MNQFYLLANFLLPFLFLRYKDQKLIALIGPVILTYAAGILLGNLVELDLSLPRQVSEGSVPIAIPLLLISTSFVSWLKNSNSTLISFGFVLLSVLVVSTVTSYAFAPVLPEFKKLAAMMVGVYTGGTPNLSAIGLAVNISSETLVLLNTADVILGALYLLFIFSFGHKFFGLFLRDGEHHLDLQDSKAFSNLSTAKKARNYLAFFILGGATLGVAVLLSRLIFEADNAPFIILFISLAGVLYSLVPKLSKAYGSYIVGEYLLLVFCFAIGTMANLQELMRASGSIFVYAAIVMFGSIILHTFFCYLFKVDRDTAIITSVAGIFGPPFVGVVAESLGKKQLIVPGITCGLVGYAIGNFLGLALYGVLN